MIDSNYKKIINVIVIILIFNLLVSALKIFLGYYTNANSIYADGFHSLSDSFNNVVGIAAIKFAYAPADENHPYGHKKFEVILSLFIGFILLILAFNIFKESILSFNNTPDLNISNLSILLMIGTIVVNIFITRYEYRMGKKLNSSFLVSDAKHTLSDVYISLSIIISLLGIKYLNFPVFVDSIMSIVVSFVILKAAISIIIEAANILSDSKLVDANEIHDIVLEFDEVVDAHMIKSRGFDNNGFIDMHIEVDPQMSVKDAHSLDHKIQSEITSRISKKVNINIHVEPIGHIHRNGG